MRCEQITHHLFSFFSGLKSAISLYMQHTYCNVSHLLLQITCVCTLTTSIVFLRWFNSTKLYLKLDLVWNIAIYTNKTTENWIKGWLRKLQLQFYFRTCFPPQSCICNCFIFSRCHQDKWLKKVIQFNLNPFKNAICLVILKLFFLVFLFHYKTEWNSSNKISMQCILSLADENKCSFMYRSTKKKIYHSIYSSLIRSHNFADIN